jgi:hypothetical protein
MSNLVDHAHRELELSGQLAEDPVYAGTLLATIAAFNAYGHSGASAEMARHQLHTLLGYGVLAPLTSDPAEWEDRREISDGQLLWQSRRDPSAFSADGGRTYWLIAEREAAGSMETTPLHTAVDHTRKDTSR